MIVIDGSIGEGGGQVLRTSLALSLVTGKPFRIEKVRAGRKNPGLLRQHLTAVNAATQVGQAEVGGNHIGSQQLVFSPGRIAPGSYRFAVGTAGSATLVLQTVLPALMLAECGSSLVLEGGTHNPFAPPFDFLTKVFLPLINHMGPRISARLERPGFYPAGGGKFLVDIEPAASLNRIELLERGQIVARQARAIIAGLPRRIAERELALVGQKMSWNAEWLRVEAIENSHGPGNVVMIEIASQNITELFTGFGERGVPAEGVAEQAVQAARRYLAADSAVGEYLADQLMIPLALAGGGAYTTQPLSRHATTNIEVIRKFLDTCIEVETITNRSSRVTIRS
jgi:RNA 3'-terminal phosphate cyclase (ATP)